MKTNHPTKLKTTPRSSTTTIFSCGFFRHCTQTVLSPTTTNPPPLPLSHTPQHPSIPPPPPPPPIHHQHPLSKPESSSSSTSSSSTTSQSFTQWKFPLPISPIPNNPYPIRQTEPRPDPGYENDTNPDLVPSMIMFANLEELFHAVELHFASGSDPDRLRALHLLERSLVPNQRATLDGSDKVVCPAAVMTGVVDCLRDKVGAKSASKILLALCLVEGNRHVGVEAGAVSVVVEGLGDMEAAVAERALAAVELLCTVAEGAAEVRAHALSVPMMVQVMGRMEGRGKEYAISVLGVVCGGSGEGLTTAPPKEVARAVTLALQGDCSERAKRKGAQLLKNLHENGRSDLSQEDK